MPLYQLKTIQKIPATIDDVWDFISSPNNLKEITPDYMGFEITNDLGDAKMYTGMIISYKVKPILGIPMTWVTEITHVEDMKYFIDEQRVGPYTIWHHQHHIEEIENGVLMSDIISYQPPLGVLGAIANKIMIKSQLKEIFDYRHKSIVEKFGAFG